ncbi:MAG: ACT domain-containing protein [Brevundimonas sp.]|nr:MAG: ACT domain-containing protein [Brevundimonas sp.]
MPAILDLTTLLATMTPVLRPGVFVFCELPDLDGRLIATLSPVVVVQEDEAVTVVVSQDVATAHGLTFGPAMRMISLTVHSALEAVGMTAAFATALAEGGISANVVAGSRHDHIFVPEHQAEDAMAALGALQVRSMG